MESPRTERRRICLLECLIAVYVFSACCTGSLGNGFDCPSSIDVTNGRPTRLKIVSRKNQTQKSFCGASLETICLRDQEFDNCRILLNLSVNLLAEARDKLVESFEFRLLQALPIPGKRLDIQHVVADLANDTHASDKVWSVNCWLDDYDCCDEGESQWLYAARLSVSYDKKRSCTADAAVKPESKDELEASSSANTVMEDSSKNTSAEIYGDKDLENKTALLVGVVAAVVIAVAGAVVTIIVVYIVCVKCSHGRRSNGMAKISQSEQTPLRTETHGDCRICNLENANVIAPQEEDSVSYSTINLNIIPTIIFSSSDDELAEDQIDSGFESILTDMRNSIISEDVKYRCASGTSIPP